MYKSSSSKPPLALIAGPTASGKSALALKLAEAAGGTVINADSAQVYRNLRLVTARPPPEEEARVPHRLYGYRHGADICSAADWAADARHALAEAWAANRLPVLVGGTGLYLRTLLDGIAPVPEIDPTVRAAVRSLPLGKAHEALRAEDPDAGSRIRPTDSARIARALEVVRSTGRTLAGWQKDKVGGISGAVDLVPLVTLPPRQWLYERCDNRFDEIFSEEGIEEVRSLLMENIPATAPVMRAIGVSAIGSYLRGEVDRGEALAAGRTATRRYAKRQYTWFRHQPPAAWSRWTDPIEAGAAEQLVSLMLGRLASTR